MLQNRELKIPAASNLAAALLAFALGSLCADARAAEPQCPTALTGATRLILVIAPDAYAPRATAQFFERSSPDVKWQKVGGAKRAVLGRGGMGWAWTFARLADGKEPIKREGDGRTPAGLFAVGKPFGFVAEPASNYVRLEMGRHICVNDTRSPHYNSVVPRAVAGAGTRGEDMGTISLYRRGLFIDYPSNREAQGGSCIFLHLWRAPNSPTAGCVAFAEPDVISIQKWSGEQPTFIGLFWSSAFNRLLTCFPGIADVTHVLPE